MSDVPSHHAATHGFPRFSWFFAQGVLKGVLHLHEKMKMGYYMVAMEAVMGLCALFALGVTTWHKDGKPFARTAFSTDAPHFKFFWIGIVVCVHGLPMKLSVCEI